MLVARQEYQTNRLHSEAARGDFGSCWLDVCGQGAEDRHGDHRLLHQLEHGVESTFHCC